MTALASRRHALQLGTTPLRAAGRIHIVLARRADGASRIPPLAPVLTPMLPLRSVRVRAAHCLGTFAALALCTTVSGCYTYRATPPATLTPGADVRLLLTPDGTSALTPSSGLRLRTMSGSVQSVTPDGSLQVLPADVTTIDGDSLPWRRAALTIPLQSLARSERRTLDRRRTFGIGGVVTAAFGAAVYFTLRSLRGDGGAILGPGPGGRE